MSNKLTLEESLSALMDNEVDDLELRRILKELPEQEHLQHTWARYHLVSSALKQETHVRTSTSSILSAVQDELANDPIPTLETQTVNKINTLFFKTLGQGAIAASVAMVVLFGAGLFNNTSPVTSNIELAETSSSQTSPSFSTRHFNGNYTASEFSRVVSYNSSESESVAKAHLTQAVYQEFDESSDDSVLEDSPLNN